MHCASDWWDCARPISSGKIIRGGRARQSRLELAMHPLSSKSTRMIWRVGSLDYQGPPPPWRPDHFPGRGWNTKLLTIVDMAKWKWVIWPWIGFGRKNVKMCRDVSDEWWGWNLDTDSVWSSRRDWRFLQTEYLRKVRDPGGFLSKTIHFLWLCKLGQNQTCFLIWNTYSMNVLFRQCLWCEHFGGFNYGGELKWREYRLFTDTSSARHNIPGSQKHTHTISW